MPEKERTLTITVRIPESIYRKIEAAGKPFHRNAQGQGEVMFLTTLGLWHGEKDPNPATRASLEPVTNGSAEVVA